MCILSYLLYLHCVFALVLLFNVYLNLLLFAYLSLISLYCTSVASFTLVYLHLLLFSYLSLSFLPLLYFYSFSSCLNTSVQYAYLLIRNCCLNTLLTGSFNQYLYMLHSNSCYWIEMVTFCTETLIHKN